jgi:uracil-DNA glycosylase family 4
MVPEDTYRSLGQIVAQIKAHLRFQKGLGINTLLSRRQTRPPITLETIRSELGDCTRCRLHKERQHLVFGEGNPRASLVFVGEAPGREEDLQGRPFVGPAGELLTRIIAAIDLKREEVYIANIVKCRPPQNRNPQPDEIQTCLPFLRKQLAAIRPRIICCLGTFAAQTLLQTEERISLLRDVWEDMKMIREEYKKG